MPNQTPNESNNISTSPTNGPPPLPPRNRSFSLSDLMQLNTQLSDLALAQRRQTGQIKNLRDSVIRMIHKIALDPNNPTTIPPPFYRRPRSINRDLDR
jgi:hypothetical protein